MKEAKFRYFTGKLSAQFRVPKVREKHGIRSGSIVLEPRFYLRNQLEITEEQYREALNIRMSEGSIAWQQRFIYPENTGNYRIEPHVFQRGEEWVEFERTDAKGHAELVNELYVEFAQGDADAAYKGWDFIAQRNGQFHGRIEGQAYCRVLEIDETYKPKAPVPSGCSPIARFKRISGLFGANSGCGRSGCGLLSLLGLLGLLLGLWKSCDDKSSSILPSPRVIHDTVYIKNGKQVKEFVDSTFIEKTDAILLPNVQFYTNSAKLLPYSIQSIQELAEYLGTHPQINALIKGHTDDVGDAQANLKLSQERAETVRQVLINFGVEPSRIEARGFGESQPKTRDQTIEARAINRRVEVELKNTETTETKRSEKPSPNP
jgi:outer membrane protein OmpA-like peptidoglycan-associated protein